MNNKNARYRKQFSDFTLRIKRGEFANMDQIESPDSFICSTAGLLIPEKLFCDQFRSKFGAVASLYLQLDKMSCRSKMMMKI